MLYFTYEVEGDNTSEIFSDHEFYSLDAEILV